MSRAKTVEEVREEFLSICRGTADYWAKVEGRTVEEKCHGVVFSLLVLLDGHTCGFPAVDLYPAPHPDDKEYAKKNGDNWYDPKKKFNDCYLHDMYYKER